MNTVERIKAICKERKIPISVLEKECGFANAYISSLKKGTIPDDRLHKVSKYLNLSASYLMTGEDHRIDAPEFSDDQFEVLSIYAQLNDKQKEAVLSMLRSMIL